MNAKQHAPEHREVLIVGAGFSGLANLHLLRQNALVLSGWTVLRYTIDTLPTMPGQVRQAMRRLGAPTSRVA